MPTRATDQMLLGEAELVSPWFSNRWRLLQDGRERAELVRMGRLHVSMATLPDGGRWLIEPAGWGVVHAVDAHEGAFAEVSRHSWIGRRWELTGRGFAYELVSRPRPRSWYVGVGGTPVAEISGSLVSYNHVAVTCNVGLPVVAVLLAWHVIARPWEAAAAPRGLVPAFGAETSGQPGPVDPVEGS